MVSGQWYGNSYGFVLVNLVAQSSDRNPENNSGASATSAVMGEGVEDEFALDLFNRVTNEPRNNLIRQVTEGGSDCRSEHASLLTATL
jgi:hypothetical protein